MKTINTKDYSDTSDELANILESQPSSTLRWGNTIILGFVLLAIIISWFVRYPDSIHGKFKIIASVSPKVLVPKHDGRIAKLFVKDGQNIQKGEFILATESLGNYLQILNLELELDTLYRGYNKQDYRKIDRFNISVYSQMGELQQPFDEFYQELSIIKYLEVNGQVVKNTAFIKKDLINLTSIEKLLLNQKANIAKDVENLEKEYSIYTILATDKTMAPLELIKYEGALLAKKNMLSQVESQILNNRSLMFSKNLELINIERELTEHQITFKKLISNLRNQIRSWKNEFLLIAPMSGTIRFTASVSENQFLYKDKSTIYILDESSTFIGEMTVPQENFGKVRKGNLVNIDLSSFPAGEYGHLVGNVETIYSISSSNQDMFNVTISIPTPPMTNYNKTISLKNGMTGDGKILTTNSRLFFKIFYQIRSILLRENNPKENNINQDSNEDI